MLMTIDMFNAVLVNRSGTNPKIIIPETLPIYTETQESTHRTTLLDFCTNVLPTLQQRAAMRCSDLLFHVKGKKKTLVFNKSVSKRKFLGNLFSTFYPGNSTQSRNDVRFRVESIISTIAFFRWHYRTFTEFELSSYKLSTRVMIEEMKEN